MAFRIKTIEKQNETRAIVTVEEIDVSSNPTGREFSEPFSLVSKDWAELKARFVNRLKDDDARVAALDSLRTEANDAKVADIIIPK